MAEHFPYVIAHGQIPIFFEKITSATVPAKVTTDYIYTVLGLKSTSFRAYIPLCKKLGFIDDANVPTQNYKDFRDSSKSKFIMGKCVKNSYSKLFSAHEFVNKLPRNELIEKIKTLTGSGANDKALDYISGTFMELCKLSNFEESSETVVEEENSSDVDVISKIPLKTNLGISYTINLNLPATTEIEVFNAIFKSLREHILDE